MNFYLFIMSNREAGNNYFGNGGFVDGSSMCARKARGHMIMAAL